MSLDIKQPITVTDYAEEKPYVVIYARLPNIASLVNFLCTKRRMPNVIQKKSNLFIKRSAYR